MNQIRKLLMILIIQSAFKMYHSVTGKNKIKGGGIGALDEIIQMSTDEYKTQEPKISINAGKEVLVYFNRRFKI